MFLNIIKSRFSESDSFDLKFKAVLWFKNHFDPDLRVFVSFGPGLPQYSTVWLFNFIKSSAKRHVGSEAHLR